MRGSSSLKNMVGYAFAAAYPDRVRRFVLIDAPIPGIGPWEQVTQDPAMWQFGFGGPDMERLVDGRERIYLDRFWNEYSLHPERFDEIKRQNSWGSDIKQSLFGSQLFCAC